MIANKYSGRKAVQKKDCTSEEWLYKEEGSTEEEKAGQRKKGFEAEERLNKE